MADSFDELVLDQVQFRLVAGVNWANRSVLQTNTMMYALRRRVRVPSLRRLSSDADSYFGPGGLSARERV